MSISYTLGYLAPNVRLRCNPVKKVSKKLLENTLLVVALTHFLRLKIKNVVFSLLNPLNICLGYILAQLAPNVKLRCGPVSKNMEKKSEKNRFFLL